MTEALIIIGVLIAAQIVWVVPWWLIRRIEKKCEEERSAHWRKQFVERCGLPIPRGQVPPKAPPPRPAFHAEIKGVGVWNGETFAPPPPPSRIVCDACGPLVDGKHTAIGCILTRWLTPL